MTDDFTYRRADGRALLGRLYRPEGAEALVVEVHGGAWTLNDRLTNAAIHKHLADSGIAVFALDFRLAPAYRYPAAIQDVNSGIRWIKANASRLGLRPRVVGGLGTSSGAHQVALAAMRPSDPRYAEPAAELAGQTAHLDFVVACWPILDPLARYRMAKAKGLKNLVEAHDAFWPDEGSMAEGNPQLVLERGEATSLPPMLVLQGTADQNVEHERADAFARCYRDRGGDIELHKFEGEAHNFVAKDPSRPAARAALRTIVAFIESCLRKEKHHG